MDNFSIQSDHSVQFPRTAQREGYCKFRPNCVIYPSTQSWARCGSYVATLPASAEFRDLSWVRDNALMLKNDPSYGLYRESIAAAFAEGMLASRRIQEMEAAQRIPEPEGGNCEASGRTDSPDENVTTRNQKVDPPKSPPPKNLKQEEKEVNCCYVDGLRDFDVLCGRGEHVNRHPGNKIFHDQKVKLQPRYLRAIKRKEKTDIAQELVDLMKSRYGSLFLGYCSEKKQYYIIDDRRVLEKAKQVLRETFTPEQRKVKRERYFRPKKKMFYAQCLADLRNAKA